MMDRDGKEVWSYRNIVCIDVIIGVSRNGVQNDSRMVV